MDRMTATEVMLKAAHLIRTQLTCKGIVGAALYDCALAEACMQYPPSIARTTVKFRVHGLMRMHLLGDPGTGNLPGKLNSMEPQAIVDALIEAAGQLNQLRLESWNPSAGRNVPHWSETDED